MAKRAAKSFKPEGAAETSSPTAADQIAQVSERYRPGVDEIRRQLKDSASKLLWNEIALANTFIDSAVISTRPDFAVRRLRHARSAYEYARGLFSGLALEPEEAERVQKDLAAIRERLTKGLQRTNRELQVAHRQQESLAEIRERPERAPREFRECEAVSGGAAGVGAAHRPADLRPFHHCL